MQRVIVAGIGTDVGKTVASAILATKLRADYWKPIQSGNPTDSEVIAPWISGRIYPSAYAFKAPLSPHHAAELEEKQILPIDLPSRGPLVIEMAGGIFAPLTDTTLSIDLFQSWQAHWILVTTHYLGSLNHTLLTIEALAMRKIPLLGLVINSSPYPEGERVLLQRAPLLGRIYPEQTITKPLIQKYAASWQFGIPSHK